MQVTPFPGAAPIPYAAAAAVQAGGRYFQETILPGLIDRYFHSKPSKFTPYTNSSNTTAFSRTMPSRYATRRYRPRRRFPRRRRFYGRRRTRRFPRRRFMRKRRLGSARRSRWSDMSNNRGGPLFYPQRLNAKFHFNYDITLTPVTAVTKQTIRTANAFQPIQGDIHQPRGWNELKAIYSNYEVIGAKVTVTFRFNNEDNEVEQNPVICFLTADNDGAYYPANQDEFYEKAVTNTKWKKLVYGKNTSVTISRYCPAKEFFGDASATTNVAAMTSAPPATNNLTYGGVYESAGGATLHTHTRIVFYTRLTKPLDHVPPSDGAPAAAAPE